MKNKNLIILIIIAILAAIIMFTVFVIPIFIDDSDKLVSFNNKIRIRDEYEFNDFRNNFSFTNLDIYLEIEKDNNIIKKDIKISDEDEIKEIWSFIKNADDPYIRPSGARDIYFRVIFHNNTGKRYKVSIAKDFNKEITYFSFSVIGKKTGSTMFSCFDKEGYIDNLVNELLNK